MLPSLTAALLLTACTNYSLVRPERQAVGDFYTVDPKIAWSSTSGENLEMWTVDGPSLEALFFVDGLTDGDTLFRSSRDAAKQATYRSGMTPTDIVEFVVVSLESADRAATLTVVNAGTTMLREDQMGAAMVESKDLRPTRFGRLPGFRFDLSFLSPEGLEREGIVVGTMHEDKLYLILYLGAREHYFPKYRDQVEELIASIEVNL
jgi:hypothetical protein